MWFVFLDVLPDGKFDVTQKLEYLYFEAVQSDGYLTSATSVSVDLLAIFFSVVMVKRVNEVEKIVEHEDPTPNRRESSSFALCSPTLPTAGEHIPPFG